MVDLNFIQIFLINKTGNVKKSTRLPSIYKLELKSLNSASSKHTLFFQFD